MKNRKNKSKKTAALVCAIFALTMLAVSCKHSDGMATNRSKDARPTGSYSKSHHSKRTAVMTQAK